LPRRLTLGSRRPTPACTRTGVLRLPPAPVRGGKRPPWVAACAHRTPMGRAGASGDGCGARGRCIRHRQGALRPQKPLKPRRSCRPAPPGLPSTTARPPWSAPRRFTRTPSAACGQTPRTRSGRRRAPRLSGWRGTRRRRRRQLGSRGSRGRWWSGWSLRWPPAR
jgi:hypothetical protein